MQYVLPPLVVQGSVLEQQPMLLGWRRDGSGRVHFVIVQLFLRVYVWEILN